MEKLLILSVLLVTLSWAFMATNAQTTTPAATEAATTMAATTTTAAGAATTTTAAGAATTNTATTRTAAAAETTTTAAAAATATTAAGAATTTTAAGAAAATTTTAAGAATATTAAGAATTTTAAAAATATTAAGAATTTTAAAAATATTAGGAATTTTAAGAATTTTAAAAAAATTTTAAGPATTTTATTTTAAAAAAATTTTAAGPATTTTATTTTAAAAATTTTAAVASSNTGAPVTNATTATTTIIPAVASISRQECGSSKLCAAEPSKCDPASGTCYFLSVKQQSDQMFNFELSGQTTGYIAAGVSNAVSQSASHRAYICANHRNGIRFFTGFINNLVLNVTETPTSNVKGSVTSGKIQCTFSALLPDTRTRAADYALSITTGDYNATSGQLGNAEFRILTPRVNLSDATTSITNLLGDNSTSSAYPVTHTQSFLPVLLVTVSILAFTAV